MSDPEYIALLEAGLRAVGDLIDDSAGVAGLHLNGDLAEWGSLRTGGRFAEWLGPFDEAMKAMVTRSPSNEG